VGEGGVCGEEGSEGAVNCVEFGLDGWRGQRKSWFAGHFCRYDGGPKMKTQPTARLDSLLLRGFSLGGAISCDSLAMSRVWKTARCRLMGVSREEEGSTGIRTHFAVSFFSSLTNIDLRRAVYSDLLQTSYTRELDVDFKVPLKTSSRPETILDRYWKTELEVPADDRIFGS